MISTYVVLATVALAVIVAAVIGYKLAQSNQLKADVNAGDRVTQAEASNPSDPAVLAASLRSGAGKL